MKKIILGMILMASLTGPALSLELVPVGQIDVRGAYNNIDYSKDSGVLLGQALFLPALKLGESDVIMPIFYANIADQSVVVEEDSFFVRQVLMLFKPSYKHQFTRNLDAKIRGEAERAYNQEAKGEILGQGLYDYEEFGGGVEAAYTTGFLGKTRFSLGVDTQHRGYPNFHTVGIAETADPSKNYYFKDYNGLKTSFEARTDFSKDTSLDISYSLLDKSYTDSYFVKDGLSGTVDYSTPRQDRYHTLLIALNSQVDENWKMSLEGSDILNVSNANYYDASTSLFNASLVFDHFSPGFYSYRTLSLKPGVRYYFQGKPEGHNLGLTYEADFRDYNGRNIRNPDGTYAAGMQADIDHTLNLDGQLALPWNFSLVGAFSHTWATSNQLYEAPLKANYRLLSANLGLQYKY